jgi:hypothetical protein
MALQSKGSNLVGCGLETVGIETAVEVGGDLKSVAKSFHARHQKSCLQAGDLLTIQTGEIGITAVVPPELADSNCHALIISRLDEQLVQRGYIKGIIGLPANLFYGTGIPACIMVLDKGGANARKGIFMIDASKGFMKDGPKNRLRAQDIHRIVDIFTRQAEVPRYSRIVSVAEISDPRNDFNLNLPRYIDSSEPEDLQDIDGHLRGGIPDSDIDALAPYWQVIPTDKPAKGISLNRVKTQDLFVLR